MPATRRVVTAVNDDGKSYFAIDEPTPHVFDFGAAQFHEVWADAGNLQPSEPQDKLSSDKTALNPPVGGSIIRIFTLVPESQASVTAELLESMADRFDDGGAMEPDAPGFHTTPTIDYIIVLSGEVDLELDAGSVHLTPGDIVVQRATRHAWRVNGQEPCVMAGILISQPNLG